MEVFDCFSHFFIQMGVMYSKIFVYYSALQTSEPSSWLTETIFELTSPKLVKEAEKHMYCENLRWLLCTIYSMMENLGSFLKDGRTQ
jgi:hypothetical protein